MTVPAKLLSDVVSGLPNDKISLVLDQRTQTVGLKCARYEASIKGIEADEFPVIPTISDAEPTASFPPALRTIELPEPVADPIEVIIPARAARAEPDHRRRRMQC